MAASTGEGAAVAAPEGLVGPVEGQPTPAPVAGAGEASQAPEGAPVVPDPPVPVADAKQVGQAPSPAPAVPAPVPEASQAPGAGALYSNLQAALKAFQEAVDALAPPAPATGTAPVSEAADGAPVVPEPVPEVAAAPAGPSPAPVSLPRDPAVTSVVNPAGQTEAQAAASFFTATLRR